MTIEQWNLKIKDLQITKVIKNPEQWIADYMEIKSMHRDEKCIFPDNAVTFIRILKCHMEEIAKKDENGGIKEIDLSYEDFSKQDFSFPREMDSDVNEMFFYMEDSREQIFRGLIWMPFHFASVI